MSQVEGIFWVRWNWELGLGAVGWGTRPMQHRVPPAENHGGMGQPRLAVHGPAPFESTRPRGADAVISSAENIGHSRQSRSDIMSDISRNSRDSSMEEVFVRKARF